MNADGTIEVQVKDRVATIEFAHPKANSLPLSLLNQLSATITELGVDAAVSVLQLRSGGQRTFCAGASFEEFQRVRTLEESQEFFSGFATLILAMKRCPKWILTCVQGKAVGGGVGLIAASDYVCATESALVRLSEYELGLGPFTVGPAIERKIGKAAFSTMSIDCDWRDAEWCLEHGLFSQVVPTTSDLDLVAQATAEMLAARSELATRYLKEMLWEGAEHWEDLLQQRARRTAELLIEKKKAERESE